jgi:hypothetical protein
LTAAIEKRAETPSPVANAKTPPPLSAPLAAVCIALRSESVPGICTVKVVLDSF